MELLASIMWADPEQRVGYVWVAPLDREVARVKAALEQERQRGVCKPNKKHWMNLINMLERWYQEPGTNNGREKIKRVFDAVKKLTPSAQEAAAAQR